MADILAGLLDGIIGRDLPAFSVRCRELQTNPGGVPTNHFARKLTRACDWITAQVETTGIAGMEVFRKLIITTDKHAGHGDIEQYALNTLSVVPQHAFVTAFQSPALSLDIIQRSHDTPLSRTPNPGTLISSRMHVAPILL